jgi:hypothetical protein
VHRFHEFFSQHRSGVHPVALACHVDPAELLLRGGA